MPVRQSYVCVPVQRLWQRRDDGGHAVHSTPAALVLAPKTCQAQDPGSCHGNVPKRKSRHEAPVLCLCPHSWLGCVCLCAFIRVCAVLENLCAAPSLPETEVLPAAIARIVRGNHWKCQVTPAGEQNHFLNYWSNTRAMQVSKSQMPLRDSDAHREGDSPSPQRELLQMLGQTPWHLGLCGCWCLEFDLSLFTKARSVKTQR